MRDMRVDLSSSLWITTSGAWCEFPVGVTWLKPGGAEYCEFVTSGFEAEEALEVTVVGVKAAGWKKSLAFVKDGEI